MERLVIPVLTAAAAEVITDLAGAPGLEVVAVAIDVGGGVALDALRDIALAAGARRCHVVDRRDALAGDVLWPALRAGVLSVPGEPVLTALSMPIVAATTVEICGYEQATSVAAWAEEPRDRQRLRALLRDSAPTLGLVSVTAGTASGMTRNLWASVEPAADAVATSASPRVGSAGRAELRIGFERGLPVSLNDVPMTPAELIDSLTAIGRTHGVGAVRVHDAAAARQWRVQAPAALALAQAMDEIAARTFDARTTEVAAAMAEAYADVVRDGAWFSAVRAGLDAFMDRVLAGATGAVDVHVMDGRIEVQA